VPGSPPIVTYDPVVRVVTISNPSPGKPWLEVGQFYTLVFPVATDDGGPFGLRAIDDATIDPATKAIAFQVAPPNGSPPVVPTIDFCVDVFPIFAAKRDPFMRGACTASGCHAGDNTAAEGLVLAKPDEIRRTAIGVLAAETANSALTTPLPPQAAFPVGMPIIDPGDPGNSYLLYKLLIPDLNGVPSASGTSFAYACAGASITPPFDYGIAAGFASADEQARLSNYVVGRRMPWGDYTGDPLHPFTLGGGTPLTLDEIERIRAWIAQGAEIDECPDNCPTIP